MTDFAFAEAADADAATLAARCAEKLGARGHTLGFVYVTPQVAASLGSVVDVLRKATGIEDWVGTVGLGVCATGTEHFEKPALSVMTANLPDGAHRMIPLINRPDGAKDGVGPAFAAGLGIVHGDPRNQQTPDIVRALAAERGAFLVGGLSAILAKGLPYNLGLVLAALLGIGAGVLTENMAERKLQEAA